MRQKQTGAEAVKAEAELADSCTQLGAADSCTTNTKARHYPAANLPRLSTFNFSGNILGSTNLTVKVMRASCARFHGRYNA